MRGRLGRARELLEQMPRNDTFLASELPMRIGGGSWRNLVERNLLEKVGHGGPDQGRAIIWKMTARARRLLED